MLGSRISRRTFTRNSATAAAAAVAAPYLNRIASAAGRELVVCSWGGTYQAAQRKFFFTPFEKETGIKVIETSAPDIARLQAMAQAGNMEWDMMAGSGRWYATLARKGLLEEIDYKKLNVTDLGYGAAQRFAVSYMLSTQVLCYSKKGTKGIVPIGWKDFWDLKKIPGPRALHADVSFKLEFALLADGVPADRLYPLDVERAFAKLAEIKPFVKTWTTFNDQPAQLLSKGEVVMAEATCGRIVSARTMGLDVDMIWDQGAYQLSYMFITRGAKHRDEAYALAAFMNKPELQAAFCRDTGYGPTNLKALELIPKELTPIVCSAPENMKNQWPVDGEWMAENYDRINDRWQKFMIG